MNPILLNFTPMIFSQLAHEEKKDYEIQPHIHNKVVRDFYTQETLIIKRGK